LTNLAKNQSAQPQFRSWLITDLLSLPGPALFKIDPHTLQKLTVAGDASAVPQDIKAIVDKAK
jgi:hypothetical protein